MFEYSTVLYHTTYSMYGYLIISNYKDTPYTLIVGLSRRVTHTSCDWSTLRVQTPNITVFDYF